MKIKTLLITTLLLSSIPLAQAGDTKNYFGAQYAMGEYDEAGFPVANPTAVVLRGGTFINKNFSVEGRFGFGLGDGSVTYSGVPVDLAVDSLFGAYALGHLPINKVMSIYGAIGYTSGELTATVPGTTIAVTESDSGMSFGLGADFNVSEKMAINVEYMNYLNETGYTFSALAVGLTGSF